jgi:hypothetical protein
VLPAGLAVGAALRGALGGPWLALGEPHGDVEAALYLLGWYFIFDFFYYFTEK